MMLEKSHGLHRSSIGEGWFFWENNKWISKMSLLEELQGVYREQVYSTSSYTPFQDQ